MTANRGSRIAFVLCCATAACAGAQDRAAAPDFARTEVGRIDGSRELLGPGTWVLLSSSGRLALDQRQERRVLLFDSTGRRIASFGRAGQGPGEFHELTNAGWVGDSLWVYDRLNDRVTVIGPEGRSAREVAIGALRTTAGQSNAYPTSGTPRILAVYPDGSMLTRISITARNARPNFDTNTAHWFVLAGDATITSHAGLSLKGSHIVRTTMGGSFISSPLPFVADPVDTIAADGSRRLVVTVRHDVPVANTFYLHLVGLRGDTLSSTAHAFSPVSLARGELDADYAALQRRHAQSNPQHWANIAARRVNATFLPPVIDAFLGSDHSIWVRLRSSSPDEQLWSVYDPAGRHRGSLRVPASERLSAATISSVWCIEFDDDDVPSLVRYRLSG